MAPLFGSSITWYTGQPSQNGPSSSHVFLSLLSRKKAPLRVPISSSVCDIEVVPPSRIEWPTYQTGGAAKNHLSLAANSTAPKMWLRVWLQCRLRDGIGGSDASLVEEVRPGSATGTQSEGGQHLVASLTDATPSRGLMGRGEGEDGHPGGRISP